MGYGHRLFCMMCGRWCGIVGTAGKECNTVGPGRMRKRDVRFEEIE